MTTTTSKPQTWFITGCSSGFGFTLARIALAAGHNITSSPHGRWIPFDVTAPASQIKAQISEAERFFPGGIDVLVNNAGYSVLGAVEDITESMARSQMETNYFGPFKVIQALLPSFRARRSGTIVNITSIGGLTALPTASVYASSKFALEALSESLSYEMAAFGVRVLIVEPGAFRTNFLSGDAAAFAPVSEPWRDTVVGDVARKFKEMNGKQMGDVEKGSRRLFEVVVGEGMAEGKKQYLRLPLGQDCLDRARTKFETLRETFDAMEEIAISTAFEE